MAFNKEFLSSLKVSDEVIDQIIAEHGKTVQGEQQKTAAEKMRADNLDTQLKTANEKLKGFDPEWETKMKAAQTDAQAEIAKLKFSYALDGAISASKAKNSTAVKALLDMDGLKQNGDEIVGLKEQLEQIKKDNDYLFETGETPPPFTTGAGNETNPLAGDKKEQANAALRSFIGGNV